MRSFLAICFAFLVSACAVNNTSSQGGDDALMLRGYDAVSYFSGAPAIGTRGNSVNHEGFVYWFASADNRAEFLKNPTRYVPQYGGFCANGMVYAVKLGGLPNEWKVIDDRLFIFGDPKSKLYFEMDQAKNIVLADGYWTREAKGASAKLQSYKRLFWQVPHYKTGAELEREYQRRQNSLPRQG